MMPFSFPESPFFQLQSVATAVITVPSVAKFENLRLVVNWGATSIPVTMDFTDVEVQPGAAPDLNAWAPNLFATTPQPDPWGAILPPSLYLQLPAPPSAASPLALQLSNDGTPPHFDDLLKAVQTVLNSDPGPAIMVNTAVGPVAPKGSATLQFPPATSGISTRMSATGAGIPSGTRVVSVGPAAGLVTLSQELSAVVPGTTPITFAPDLGALSIAQCKNIAYEIVWSQQPPLPEPPSPDLVEQLYSSSSNSGNLMSGSTPNHFESDRQQFEGKLKSYYSVADTTADRLANFVYALSAAVACEQQSLGATEALVEFPVDPGQGGSTGLVETETILTGLSSINPATNFGVPAAYFYALGALMPAQLTPQQRYQLATRDKLTRLLTDFTSAINAETITDNESFVTSPLVSISAAQAARRICAFGIPPGSATPLAPLDTVQLTITTDADATDTLSFASTAGISAGMFVSGPNILPGTTVGAGLTATMVTLSAPVLNKIPSGSKIIFTPPYPAALQTLIKDWFNYPAPVSGEVSCEIYSPSDDATNFWHGETSTVGGASALLSLVLSALTQGYELPAPFNVSLGDKIITDVLQPILNPPTVATLASITADQLKTFFETNPSWLPPFTRPGDTAARIAAFVRYTQKFFDVGTSGPPSSIILVTVGASVANTLTFTSTSGVALGMTASGPNIPPGTTVSGISATPPTVTLASPTPLAAGAVPSGANIIFTPRVSAKTAGLTLLTVAPTPGGTNAMQFASTAGVVVGMSVTGPATIQAGTLVDPANPPSGTNVWVTPPVTGVGVGSGISVTFTPNVSASAWPLLQAPSTDWITKCLTVYGVFVFGTGFNLAALDAAAATVFPGDAAAQAWLVDALVTIDALYQVINPLGLASGLEFSVVEALYARGFKSAADITELVASDFQQAVVGTVAYDSAPAIYASASTIAPPPPQPVSTGGGFQPVNDGSLVNCIPPECFSPLGPIEYLHELLNLSANSTCDLPFVSTVLLTTVADTPSGQNLPFASTTGVIPGMDVSGVNIPAGTNVLAVTGTTVALSHAVSADVPNGSGITFASPDPTLEIVLAQRRGPVGDLDANCSNCETKLPLIDIVDECLEYLAASTPPSSGAIYDTSGGCIELATNTATAPGSTSLLFKTTACLEVGMYVCGTNVPPHTSVAGLAAGSVTLSQPLTGSVPSGTNFTFSATLASHELCCKDRCGEEDDHCCRESDEFKCHDPERIFAALPEYSTPATPVAANSAVEPLAFNNLKVDFSSCCLPYSQGLDVSRTYLRHFRSCRFEEMRTFRKCITEFVLDPVNEPIGFQSHIWRYPVRIDIAIEYMGITPEEYAVLFEGAQPLPCATPKDDTARAHPAAPSGLAAWQLYGFSSAGGDNPWITVVRNLSEFLARTCLTYCEFFELWQSGFVKFRNGADRGDWTFPRCEPCCLDKLVLDFPEGSSEQGLLELAVFIRLWRKLRESGCFCYTFAELRDICDVLQLFIGGAINPDFIRQLAAFQMFRDHFEMPLVDPDHKTPPSAVDADRTHLLALWVGPASSMWSWAVRQLILKVGHHARKSHKCKERSAEFVKLLASNMDPLSKLTGFDPASATKNWHALPTHTLRFAEVLAKIYASNFSIGEILYLFTADDHLDGDDPFPLQEQNEALDLPLGLPDEDQKYSLWHLRHKLLEVHVEEENLKEWHWKRIETTLHDDFGFALNDILALGRHFFSELLEHAGYTVDSASRRYVSDLAAASTSPAMWNSPPDGPFQYVSGPTAEQLWTRIPLYDESVIAKLSHVHKLNPQEQKAVQDLYYQPRAMLANFALLFPNFAEAQQHLVEEREERERWSYFRKQVVICHHRYCIIAEHLSRHVANATGQEFPEGEAPAFLILRSLFADENEPAAGASWENDAGTSPAVTWGPPPNGRAFAALLGLAGTGLVCEYTPDDGSIVWRDVCGNLSVFGHERNKTNCPVPAVLPAMTTALTPQQMQFVSVHNGFLLKDATGTWLGGGQGFRATWQGALLVEHEGTYEFWVGAPEAGEEKPNWEAAEHRRWRVILKRGQRTWVISSHHWPGEEEHRSSALPLKRGAYELTVEMIQPTPEFLNDEQAHRQHSGLQLKYSGPDSDGHRVEVPHSRLFAITKANTLGDGLTILSPGATSYLSQLYVSSLRDIRRTYQRAFKALMFAHRFKLSAKRKPHGTSELGYMLSQASNFAGVSYYNPGGGFIRHAANFDFNFLPVEDDFYSSAPDSRTNPSEKRIQAMFDWWERLFDYSIVRHNVHHCSERHLWHLFDEANEQNPAHPAHLLRHMGADSRHWHLDLRYYQGQNVNVYSVTTSDLKDDRWTTRAWHADRWLRALQCFFACKEISVARPDLWASDDPSAKVTGESESGNANLSAFLCDGCFENRDPRRYEEVKRLNDGLRKRGRDALVSYLCHMNRVPLPWLPGQFAEVPGDLSDLLLLDVEVGVCEKVTRIEEAISAAQSFIRRARLHLEPGWTITHAFVRMWDREFATYHVWQACKRRQLYKENWVEWNELEKARRVEAFRFLETKLCTAELTVAAPGGPEWWPDERSPRECCVNLLQKEPSGLQVIPSPHVGLNLLGTPERDARPSWLALVESSSSSSGNQDPGASSGSGSSGATALPFWLEAAIRLGTRFYRIAAAGMPPASMGFEPHKGEEKGCVTCCEECGCSHPACVDEYYFWLVDDEYYQSPVTPAPSGFTSRPGDFKDGYQQDFYDPSQQEAALWQDENQLPQLLEWSKTPAVRLAWCRVHNGAFQQPRRSHRSLQVLPNTDVDLTFVGRSADSIVFSVSNAVAPQGYSDPSDPGFRYDLARDAAVALPQVMAPPPTPTFPGGLPAYPYFVFVSPGTHLIPLSLFSPSLAVASALRSRCCFEAALEWYRLAFDPLQQDCTWVNCNQDTVPAPPTTPTGGNTPGGIPGVNIHETRSAAEIRTPDSANTLALGACCDSTDVSCDQAKDRSIILHYLETLVEWGEAVMRRGNSQEAMQQARVIFDAAKLILGKDPRSVRLKKCCTSQTITTFTPEFAPLNPRLLNLYEIVRDRLDAIHDCLNSRRLRNGEPCCDMPYFGQNCSREDWQTSIDHCVEDTEGCCPPNPYRFIFLMQKAQELASRVQELNASVLSACEKGDAEYLASARAGQERELLSLTLQAKQDQWRDADWQIEALQKTKAVSQANLTYYNGLINAGPGGLINGEIQYQSLISAAISLRGAANITEGIGEVLRLIPDLVLGAAGFGGSPVSITWIPLGTKIGEALEAVARIMNNSAEITSQNAQLDETDAGWQRRLDEWMHQTEVLAIEIQQVERQILGAQRRRDQALVDLNGYRRQMEHAAEIQNFLRDKFTAHNLYLFLQKETLALCHKMYDLALCAARQAQDKFNLERGHTTRHFLPECTWNSLHEGLMSGERLSVALHHMEKAYLDENVREYELTKNFSMRLHFPMEFLRLKSTGRCEINIPEWMFDLDFPGQYMRRIKSVSLTLPCVTGPFTGVHCRLTLLSSMTRMDPRLSAPAHGCCCPPEPCDCECREEEDLARQYEPCPDDPRVVRHYGAREAIATSTGQNDSGLFELNFRDERYLPFEYMGAVSCWRLELPQENNYFPLHTLSEAILRVNYTSREGGDLLRRAANAAAHRHLPGDGWCLFDVHHEFPDAWQLFRDRSKEKRSQAHLRFRLDRKMFPFIPGANEIWITKMAILFEGCEGERECECHCPEIIGCTCLREGKPACRMVELNLGDKEHHHEDDCERIVPCFASERWPDFYSGLLEERLGPLGGRSHSREVKMRFPDCAEVDRIFILCRYAVESCCGTELIASRESDGSRSEKMWMDR